MTQNFSLSQKGDWSIQVGVAGYTQWQTNENGGPILREKEGKYSVNAAGFTIGLNTPFQDLNLSVAALWEYGARSTVQGQTMIITAGLEL